MLRRALIGRALMGAACIAASGVLADPTGAVLQPLVAGNAVIGADGRIALALVNPVAGFAQELEAIDREGVIALVAGTDPAAIEGIVLFSPNWTAAAFVAREFGADALSARILANEGTGVGIDIATVDLGGAEPLHFYTIIPGAGGFEIPAVCYARLIGSVIYAGGAPQAFFLPSCVEALQ